MRSFLTTICQQVEQQLMTPGDLERIVPGEIFAVKYASGNFFDYMGTYLFVAKKGQINDWAIYGIAVMTEEESSENPHIQPQFLNNHICFLMEAARVSGLKLTSEENIRLIVPCTDEMFQLYRR